MKNTFYSDSGVSEQSAIVLIVILVIILIVAVAAGMFGILTPVHKTGYLVPKADLVNVSGYQVIQLRDIGGDPFTLNASTRMSEYYRLGIRLESSAGSQQVQLAPTTGNQDFRPGDQLYIYQSGMDAVMTDKLSDVAPTGNFPAGDLALVLSDDTSNVLLAKIGLAGGAGGSVSPTVTSTQTPSPTPTPVTALAANFTATPLSGYAPLAVQFTDTSTGPVTTWNWTFGDGNFSSVQSPAYTYPAAGNYSVSLVVTNGADSSTLTKPDHIWVTEMPFVNYVIEKDVFVYGSQLSFSGTSVSGPDATVIITKPLTTGDLNGGTSIAVHTIYVNGDVTLDGGSAGLGSPGNPGNIYVNGNMNLLNGVRDIYGNVYVAGNFNLKDARIHGNVYVNGDVTLGYTPTLDADSHIYYTGTLRYPDYYSHMDIVDKCIHQATVPAVTMPDLALPATKTADWYATRGYVSSGPLASNLKIYADSYSSTTWMPSVTNVVIIARNGDITLTGLGGSSVSGVLYAPNGRITFGGASFTGVVIARDGFSVTSGGTLVTFTNLEDYFSSPADYPF